jgi:L-lactate utilization protein LutC
MSFDALATMDQVQETIRAVTARGLKAEVLETGQDALARIRELIPAGSTVSSGASLTLREIGFEDLFKAGAHPWKNLKAEYLAEKDPARQSLLRRQSVLADYFLGSVHAVSLTGEVVVASMTGSQISPYAYAARNLIWVVGAQKITPTLEQAIRRVREYILPHENARMLESSGGKMGSRIGKLLIFEHEVPFLGRNVTLLFVNQKLGD